MRPEHNTLSEKLRRPAICSIARAWERSPVAASPRVTPRQAVISSARWVAVLALISPAFLDHAIPIWAELLCVALACALALADEIRSVVALWKSGRDARRKILKTAAWTVFAIAIFVPSVPFICWAIYSMAWGVAELCCERRSDAYETVMFSIAMGTIPVISLSAGVWMCVSGQRAEKRFKARQAHETNAAAVELAMAERTNTTLH